MPEPEHEPSPQPDTANTRLGFVDVLFAIAVGKVIELSTEGMSFAGRAHLALAAVTTLLSYVGYRNSRNRYDYELDPLRNAPFYHFLLDVLLVYIYFLLATTSELSGVQPSALQEAQLIVGVFGAYVAWDALAWCMRRSSKYQRATGATTKARRNASPAGLAVSLVILGAVLVQDPSTSAAVVVVDAALLALVIVYRLFKRLPPSEATTTPSSAPRP